VQRFELCYIGNPLQGFLISPVLIVRYLLIEDINSCYTCILSISLIFFQHRRGEAQLACTLVDFVEICIPLPDELKERKYPCTTTSNVRWDMVRDSPSRNTYQPRTAIQASGLKKQVVEIHMLLRETDAPLIEQGLIRCILRLSHFSITPLFALKLR
jgi:hypothetical protein